MNIRDEKILIFGATGNMGGSAIEALLNRNFKVRAATRNINGKKAKILSALDVELVQADMEDRKSLDIALEGINRVFSVQNWVNSGIDGEVRQAKLVADAAKDANIKHLIYGSAGINKRGTGVPHFECKIEVEDYMRSLNLPFTILRPAPFMELLTQKEFFPPLAFWGAGPKILGWNLPIPWTAVKDIGKTITNIFEKGDDWIGKEIELIGDVCSLGEAKKLFREIKGKNPFRLPLPVPVFDKMAGKEFSIMWRWMHKWINEIGTEALYKKINESRKVSPDLMSMEDWLRSG